MSGTRTAATLLAIMDRNEYQRRRLALEELYQADLRLLRAAHEARVRSLEALWLALDGDALPPLAVLHSAPERALLEPGEAPALPPAPSLPDAPLRTPDLRMALEDALPALPDLFEKKDVIQALGWTPSRSSLYRVLSDMELDGFVVCEKLSSGRTPTRYRKAPSPPLPR